MLFDSYIGIDYSGAETPEASLKGLRVYKADGNSPPIEVQPPVSPRRYWTRREIGNWLVAVLSANPQTLVGIDHGFSFPIKYFEKHGLEREWQRFLDDFETHWPTADDHVYVDFVREGVFGNGAARTGNSRWRRLTEIRAGAAKSVFHFDVPGSVAKSTHAGLPWLRFIRARLADRVHFWPFDGWEIPVGRSVIAEVYPSLWSRAIDRENRTQDQHDAFCVASWMQNADRLGTMSGFFAPKLHSEERRLANIEGWILGIP